MQNPFMNETMKADIRRWRMFTGKTFTDIAERTNLAESTIHRTLSGETRPLYETVMALCDCCDLDPYSYYSPTLASQPTPGQKSLADLGLWGEWDD